MCVSTAGSTVSPVWCPGSRMLLMWCVFHHTLGFDRRLTVPAVSMIGSSVAVEHSPWLHREGPAWAKMQNAPGWCSEHMSGSFSTQKGGFKRKTALLRLILLSLSTA